MSGRTTYWNEERRQQLADLGHLPKREIASFFGKTEESILKAAASYGIKLLHQQKREQRDDVGPGRSDLPLPAGSPESWGAIVAGTVLEGCPFE